MHARLGETSSDALRRVAALLVAMLKQEPNTLVLGCACAPVETIGDAIPLSEVVDFQGITKELALSTGLKLIADHLLFKEISVTILIAHFMAYHRSCKTVNAEAEADTVLSFLVEILESHLEEITEVPREPETPEPDLM
jgi:hypothetical protein